MSNKLRSFLIVIMSIVVVMAALPMNAIRVNADGFTVTYWLETNTNIPAVTDNSGTIKDPSYLGLEKYGHTFDGWTDESGNPYSVDTQVDQELVLYGNWTFDSSNYVKVALNPDFDGLAGEGETVNDVVVAKNGAGIAMPDLWKAPDHYRLSNWTANEDGTGNSYPVSGGSYTLADGDTTLYAQWKQVHIITYDANSDYISPKTVEDTHDAGDTNKYQLNPNAFQYEGYKLISWIDDSDNSGNTVYGPADLIVITSDLNIHAKWVREITFHANNGIDPEATDKQTIPVSSTEALKLNGFTNNGKTFVGWSTQPVDTTIKYVDGESVAITGNNTKDVDVNLYAQWGNTCTIHFDPNYLDGTTGTVTMSDLAAGKGFTTHINNVYSVTGYTLKEWNTEQDGSGDSYNSTDIFLDETFAKDTMTLYAQWEKTPYSIEFLSEDGSTPIETLTCYYGETPAFTQSNPSKEKTEDKVFVFDGWSTDKDSTGAVLTSLPEVTGVATYYAHFKSYPRYYLITAQSPAAGGSVSSSGSCEWNESATVSVTLDTGYHVEKWIDNGNDVASTATTYTIDNVTEAHTVEVVLAKDPHTVTVSATEGGTAALENSNLVYGDTAKAVATAGTGYSFVHWVDEGNPISSDPTYSFTVTRDCTLTAVFKLNSYDISLTSDGHGRVEASDGNESVEGGSTYNYSTPITVRAIPDTGYHFVKWTDGNGTEITSASYEFEVYGDRDLKASFALNSYNIEVTEGDHGSVTGEGIYYYGESITVKAKPDTGYHFVNWTSNGNVVSTNANYTFMVSGPAELTANFAINTYTVKFVNDDGTLLREGQFVYGSTAFYQVNATPTKKATAQYTYTFAGWDKKLGTVTEDITYTAVYDATVNKYKITFQNEDGSVLQTSEVEYGKLPVFEKGTPTKASTVQESFSFAGWDKEISKVTGEAVYTATYTSKKITRDDINYLHFTVTFESNGGSEVVSQLVADGGVAFKPEEPMRERYTFGGWYIDAALTKPFSFATPITSDITLYAKWIKGSPDVEATYAVVGLGSMSWTQGSGEDFTVSVERSKDNDTIASHFKGVQIDGVDLDYYLYELSEDNGAVIIRSDALGDLDAGSHTVTIVYDDGTAEAELIITKANKPVETEEEVTPTEAGGGEREVITPEKPSLLGLWIALAIVGGVVICALPIIIIKRRGIK